jgi:hypothetical protein
LTKTPISGIFGIPINPVGGRGTGCLGSIESLNKYTIRTSEESLMNDDTISNRGKFGLDSAANGGRSTGVKNHRTGVKNPQTGVKRNSGEWLIDTGVKDLA